MATLGTSRNRSVVRMRTWSRTPPKKPAIEPMATPITVLTKATNKPTLSETRPARMTRVSTSRPFSSVPNQCLALGGLLKLASVSALSSG